MRPKLASILFSVIMPLNIMEKDKFQGKAAILSEFRSVVTKKSKYGPQWELNNICGWFPGGFYTSEFDRGRIIKDKEIIYKDSNTGEIKKITCGDLVGEVKDALIATGHTIEEGTEVGVNLLRISLNTRKGRAIFKGYVKVIEDVWVHLRLKGFSDDFLKDMTS
jgi:hypothetical protein